jgi:hypothetical protein
MPSSGLNSSPAAQTSGVDMAPKGGADLQIQKAPPKESAVPADKQLPRAKKQIFTAKKEDPALVGKLTSEDGGYAGQFNGIGAMIDGYLRINKRRYGQRGNYRPR